VTYGVLLYKKEGNNGPNIVHRPAHNAVSRLAPRLSAPMHNIGAVTAVMADALLKDTAQGLSGSLAEQYRYMCIHHIISKITLQIAYKCAVNKSN